MPSSVGSLPAVSELADSVADEGARFLRMRFRIGNENGLARLQSARSGSESPSRSVAATMR